MANKMLIDASHPEETRVVVVRGQKVEEFDFESATRRQLRGNISLAKVTRVEPSLQAAFVEYGGNRHGFLAFSEIHPDYYQIPVADRQALLEDDARAARDEDEEDRRGGGGRRRGGGRHRNRDSRRRDESVRGPAPPEGEGSHAADASGEQPFFGNETPHEGMEASAGTMTGEPYADEAHHDHHHEAQAEAPVGETANPPVAVES